MLNFTNAENPLGRQSESFEEFWESLNKFKEEEGTSGEAHVQRSRVEAPRSPPTPIHQASGKQLQRAKHFVKARSSASTRGKGKGKAPSKTQVQAK